ncbi:MAG: signal recognition particle-docking protein FtsY [Nanoarchaeota archaeon]|nr:signal recognition particle-docking protein FtsY [Nanoarchaeota archaeon]MBU1269240.1 signal recognition particle-docking protein FtsY [Nanoarchaeota archaeon]MBU1604926.1 signal recognition particle-docking protein FtsY [Nanoarchaeota archaeon]MBU2443505.1 signal recognition particle-docking protein FtsY [Nanoarchaeota archaeon]
MKEETTKKEEKTKEVKADKKEKVSEKKKEEKILEKEEEKKKSKQVVVEKDKKIVKTPPAEEVLTEKKSFLKKIFGKKEEEQPVVEEKKAEPVKEEIVEEKEEEKGFFKKITETVTKFNLSEARFDELFWNLEVTLLENNVAVEVIEKIKADLKEELTTGKISRKGVEEVIRDTLKKSIEEVLDVETFDLLKRVKTKKPFIIAFIGINGSGKTTNMAKVAKMLQNNGLSVVFAASDTFRAAAIHQLEEHANRLKIKMIKHDYNADPAAVAFDAIEHAKAKGIDVVMIDTAGRLHSNTNLMDELKKIIRVNKPDLKIFVGESITGNDCVEQARVYNEAVGIDAIILAKADVDEKGGAAISVSYITKKPILYIGTGQTYDDLKKFDKELVIKSLGL